MWAEVIGINWRASPCGWSYKANMERLIECPAVQNAPKLEDVCKNSKAGEAAEEE